MIRSAFISAKGLVAVPVEARTSDRAAGAASAAWRARAAGATRGTGSTTRATCGCDSRKRASSRAEAAAMRSTRSDMVSRPLTSTQALKGDIDGPVWRMRFCTGPSMNSLVPEDGAAEHAALAVDVLRGGVDDRCRRRARRSAAEDRGAEDVVDDHLWRLPRGPARLTAAMSTSSCIGLLGVSKKTAVVGSDSASRHWSRSGRRRRRSRRPSAAGSRRGSTKHEPKRARAATTRSPWPSSAPSATKTADMPEPVAKHASAPSSCRSRSSNIATVGLP